jgi:hypothetical protein
MLKTVSWLLPELPLFLMSTLINLLSSTDEFGDKQSKRL